MVGRWWIPVLWLVVAGAVAGSPANEGPARRESPASLGPIGQQRVVEMVRLLERRPFDPDAAGTRAVLMKYLVEAPDVEVTVHGDLLGDPEQLQGEHAGIIVGQMMFAMGAFLIEHPHARTNDLEVQVAGVEGALRVYASVKAAKPEVRLEPLERLLKMQAAGTLAGHVKSLLARRAVPAK